MVWTKEKQRAYMKEYRLKNKVKLSALNVIYQKKRYQQSKKAKECRLCKKEFISTLHSHFFFCSDTCAKAKRKLDNKKNERNPKRKAYRKIWEKTIKRQTYLINYAFKRKKQANCKECDTEFTTSKESFYFCSDTCRKIYTKEYDKKYGKSPKVKARFKIYNQRPEVKERKNTWSREYRKTVIGRAQARYYNQKRREWKKGIIDGYTKKEFLAKVSGTKGFCPACNERFTKSYHSKHELTLDHTPPVSKVPKGFVYTIAMITPLCRSCNAKKGNKDLWYFSP